MEYDLKQNDRVKHLYHINSTNVALILSKISVNESKMRIKTKIWPPISIDNISGAHPL